MQPHYPDQLEGCVNGCDSTLCQILEVNLSSSSPSSTSQTTNRNSTNQNRGGIFTMNSKYFYFDYFLG